MGCPVTKGISEQCIVGLILHYPRCDNVGFFVTILPQLSCMVMSYFLLQLSFAKFEILAGYLSMQAN